MYAIYIVFSAGILTTIVYSCLVRTDYEDECVLPPTTRTPSIFGTPFSFGEECT
jgi:hypothetical protein